MEITTPVGMLSLPDSTRTSDNKKSISKNFTNERNRPARLDVVLRWDDSCKNGYNQFSVTGTEWECQEGHWTSIAGGCLHDRIAEQLPELAFALPYHMFSPTGPLYYFANTVFLAGTHDCWGTVAGEQRQQAKTGLLMWQLQVRPFDVQVGAVEPEPYQVDFAPVTGRDNSHDSATATLWRMTKSPFESVTSVEKPTPRTFRYVPVLGESKQRELDLARRAACWPNATDEQLSLPREELEKQLAARLPALVAEFKATVEKLGFTY